jgi:hypothetical protein
MSSRSKVPRDPGAPKRNQSAYLLYQNAMRETFKAQNPGMSFGQLSKYTSAMYAELTPEEKEHWISQAEQDKSRYLHELANYVPPPGFDAKGDAVMTYPKGGGRRGKKERDPLAPKRNQSAYLLYQNAMREPFRRDNPGMTFGQLSKYTSAMYKCLTPDEKAQWEARAQHDKMRYDSEMTQYVPPPGYDSSGILLEDHRIQQRKKKARDPSAPKRARGSFVYFTDYARPLIQKEFPDIKFTEMGSVMGERWRALSAEEKKEYEDKAAADKQRFAQEMERYQEEKAAQAPPPAAAADHHDIYGMNHHLQYTSDPSGYTYDTSQYHYPG